MLAIATLHNRKVKTWMNSTYLNRLSENISARFLCIDVPREFLCRKSSKTSNYATCFLDVWLPNQNMMNIACGGTTIRLVSWDKAIFIQRLVPRGEFVVRKSATVHWRFSSCISNISSWIGELACCIDIDKDIETKTCFLSCVWR